MHMYKWLRKWFKKPNKESRRVLELRDKKQSDTERWIKGDVMHGNWQDRTLLLSNYIKDNSSVVEFGAGNAVLQEVLNNSIEYQAVDIVKRKENYLVCDLNVHPLSIDLAQYDTAVFSGVLEYVYDLDLLFLELSKSIKYIPLSYACSNICKQDRLLNGWLSDYTSNQLEAIFDKYSYKVLKRELWRDQSIYFLEHE